MKPKIWGERFAVAGLLSGMMFEVFFQGRVWADLPESQCSPIRLDEAGGSMAGIPVRDQRGDTCYAHAAVDLIDAKMGWQSAPSSPLDAAAHFKADTPRSWLEAFGHYWRGSKLYEEFVMNRFFARDELGYGITANLIQYLQKEGVCEERQAISERDFYAPGFSGSATIKEGLKKFWDDYNKNPELTIESQLDQVISAGIKHASSFNTLSKARANYFQKECAVVESELASLTEELKSLGEPLPTFDQNSDPGTLYLGKNSANFWQEQANEARNRLAELRKDASRAYELPVGLQSLYVRLKYRSQALGVCKKYAEQSVQWSAEVCSKFVDSWSAYQEVLRTKTAVDQIRETLERDDVRKLYAKMISLRCQKRRKIDRPLKVVETPVANLKDLESQVRKSFDSARDPKQPFAVSYCSRFLTQGSSVRELMLSYPLNPWRCGMHASVIIGRRYNTEKKQCELLLKNSWGEGGWHHKDFQSEKGKVWVHMDVLGANAIRLTSLEDAPGP